MPSGLPVNLMAGETVWLHWKDEGYDKSFNSRVSSSLFVRLDCLIPCFHHLVECRVDFVAVVKVQDYYVSSCQLNICNFSSK